MTSKPIGDLNVAPRLNADLTMAPYGAPPQLANDAFAKGIEAVLMKSLGIHLSCITSSDNFHWPAIRIRDYFSDHFGEIFEEPAKPNVPKFLLPPEHRVSPQIIPAAFRYRLGSLVLATPDQACVVVGNLNWLTDAFHLSSTERKVLLWTYVLNCPVPSPLEGVMSEIQFANEAQAHAVLSLLLDEPQADVAKCFGATCRLRGMRLIDSHPWRYPLTLERFFQSTVNLSACLQINISRWPDIWMP